MLISQVPEEGGSSSSRETTNQIDDSYEYKSASELFDLMARNQNFQPDDDETLTARDLVLIYKNLDLGNELMNNANEIKRRTPNQYVETVVYEDLETDSEISEIYSNEDIHNVVLVNKERIDLLNNPPPLESTVCSKFGNLDLISPSLTDMDRKMDFRDQYFREQLKNLNAISKTDKCHGQVLPTSLLDYICCKSLEDNYTFYMDNIINYVTHTIDQLKRISNGDYLTDKAKEKWREVVEGNKLTQSDNKASKVLANSISIPLYVERKITGDVTKWDELVHSEVDVRSLSKILEKKIIVEVPKVICGSYKLFSKCCDDNIIISCKREKPLAILGESEQSRVDVVLKLNRSDSGHVISNISSVMILKQTSENATDILPSLLYKQTKKAIADRTNDSENEKQDTLVEELPDEYTRIEEKQNEKDRTIDSEYYDPVSYNFNEYSLPLEQDMEETGESEYDVYMMEQYNLADPISNQMSDQPRFNMQTLPEEVFEDNAYSINTTNSKKSPAQKRVKSPYENRSHVLEERKRNKLLEIKRKREKKKLAMTESKVNKHRFAVKGTVTPHTASSITKLPITNKSFYNSIYGKSTPSETNYDQSKIKGQKTRKSPNPDSSENVNTDNAATPKTGCDIDKSQKYINKTFYLDNAETEVMFMEIKKKDANDLPDSNLDSRSAASNDFSGISGKVAMLKELLENDEQSEIPSDILSSTYNSVPTNTPKDEPNETSPVLEDDDPKTSNTSADFRKSIDKIYELIKKLGKNEGGETKLCKSKFTAVAANSERSGNTGEVSLAQYSDSGTSLKHLVSSNTSMFSFDKNPNPESSINTTRDDCSENQLPAAVVPKVIINAKPQIFNEDSGKRKKANKRNSPVHQAKSNENPLKAISQLLQEFDNVQKTRNKTAVDVKINKKPEINVVAAKTETHQTFKKTSKPDNRLKDSDPHNEKFNKMNTNKERKLKITQPTEPSKYPSNKMVKKKVVDIVDEIKEARGEAVRGPKLTSRLNSLAQPKRTYVQAQIEDFQARYGKNFVSDRLQKLSLPSGTASERMTSPKQRKKSVTDSGIASTSFAPSAPAALEKYPKKPFCNSSSAACSTSVNDPSTKQSNSDVVHTLKKKMVAVESYVSNHFGTATSGNSDVTSAGHKSKVPLFPNDLDLSSVSSSLADESSTIGSKLHNIIDNIHYTYPAPKQYKKQYSKSDKEPSPDNFYGKGANDKCTDTDASNQSDVCTHHCIPVDITKPPRLFKRDEIIGDTIPEESDVPQENDVRRESESSASISSAVESRNSKNELVKLENALYRCMSIGTFPKRLRLKNLTLTPKESMQQILLLQSGDTKSSLLLKSTISQNIKIDAKHDTTFRSLSDLSNVDWSFHQFPMQISTVGYSFASTNLAFDPTKQLKQIVEEKSIPSVIMSSDESRLDKTSQSAKSDNDELLPIKASQVDVKELIAISSIVTFSSTLMKHLNEPTSVEKETCSINKNLLNNTTVRTDPATEPVCTLNEVKANEDDNKEETISKDTTESLVQSAEKAINVAKECIKKTPVIEYTTSLDILAGLLSEIQNISTRQTEITTKSDFGPNKEKELTTILKKGSNFGSMHDSCNIISLTSLDKMRQLESNASIYSMYNISSNNDYKRPFLKYEDKEVDAVGPKLELINRCTNVPSSILSIRDRIPKYESRCTDVPSCGFPITVTHSTNMTNSLIGIISETSSQSTFTYDEHPLHYDASLTSLTKFIKHPKTERVPVAPPTKTNVSDLSDKYLINRDQRIHIDNVESRRLVQLPLCNKTLKRKCYADSDFDATIKMKRDILVTMYSVLVLTVFAALSFPEILYRI